MPTRTLLAGIGFVVLLAVVLQLGFGESLPASDITPDDLARWKTELSNWGRWEFAVTFAPLIVRGGTGAAVAAQPRPYPVYNEYHLDRTMKLVGRNFPGALEALDAGDFDTAKALFTRTREQVAISITFWRHNERDDGVRMLRAVLDGLDALDAALSRPPIDAAAAAELATGADAACQTCHAVYRAQDPDTGEYSVNLTAGQPR